MIYRVEMDDKQHLLRVFKDGELLGHLESFILTLKMDVVDVAYSSGGVLTTDMGIPHAEVTGRLESSNYAIELGAPPKIFHRIDVIDQYGQAPKQEEFMGRIQEATFKQTKEEVETPTLELKITFR